MVPFPSFGFGFLLKYTWSLFILLRKGKYYYMSVFIHSFLSNSLTALTVAHRAPLSMRFFQSRILAWVVIPSSRVSSRSRDRTWVSCIAGGFFTDWATKEKIYMHSVHNLCVFSQFSKWYYKVDTIIFSLLERKNHEAQFLSNLVKRKLGKLA